MYTFNEIVDESTTKFYRAVAFDQDDAPIPAADVDTVTVTIYSRDTGAIINGRDNQNIKNVNGGTWSAAGIFQFELTPLDTAILDDSQASEWKIVLIKVSYGPGGARKFNHDFQFMVKNKVRVP